MVTVFSSTRLRRIVKAGPAAGCQKWGHECRARAVGAGSLQHRLAELKEQIAKLSLEVKTA